MPCSISLTFISPKLLYHQKGRRPSVSMMANSISTSLVGFKNLMETYTLDIHRAEGRKLNVPLIAPFTIATSRVERVENVAIRVELSNGCCGWGEAPVLPFVTAEDQDIALTKAGEACDFLKNYHGMSLGHVLTEVGQLLPGHHFASVRAGVEMAVIDAVATSIGTPLWRFFGGVSNTITTDITIPIVSPTEAGQLALKYYKQGFKTLKLKVGKDLNADIEVLQAIRMAHPHCLFILDANEGYTSSEAIQVLEKLNGLDLMIGGMVETRLAMGFAGHLAAGLGAFKFIDLDTPLLLSEDPVLEGYEVSGPTYKFSNARGHGGFLHWDNIACLR
uniref:L-Ala-D/L-amino acid epimerase isoform X2 n=1 Tax=Erigeron canadensis TaxID=72917 RepID=UPI001CB9C053|nr:L-Ala-D/L-amino acid epimerase isoform X2 [Erigeron canadensis]